MCVFGRQHDISTVQNALRELQKSTTAPHKTDMMQTKRYKEEQKAIGSNTPTNLQVIVKSRVRYSIANYYNQLENEATLV